MSRPIRVVIAEDHALLRQALAALLEPRPEIEVVGAAADGLEALALVEQLAPDVLLLDLTMPRKGGLEVIESLRRARSRVRIVVVTMHSDAATLRAALDAGTDGYILKHADADELLRAITSVSRGVPYVSVTAAARAPSSQEVVRPPPSQLTQREREVLVLLARGHTNKEVAEKLGITVKTAETHRLHLTAKLDRRSRAELVEYAAAAGLLPALG